MGGKQSKLKKKIEALQADAIAAAAKHTQDVETLRNEKRMLEFKLHALQEMTAKAQVEAEKATQLAVESEEKVKALKWELVRRVSVPTVLPTSPASSTTSTSSSVSPLTSATNDSIPRVPVNWKLKEGVALHRSNTAFMPSSRSKPMHQSSERLQKRSSSSINATPLPQTKSLDTPDNSDGTTTKTPPNNQENRQSKPVATPIAIAPTNATPHLPDTDIFAPVKRRSSTRDAIVTIVAEAEVGTVEPIDTIKNIAPGNDSDSKSDTFRDQDGAQDVGRARSVRAATKERGPPESKTDNVLAFSDADDD